MPTNSGATIRRSRVARRSIAKKAICQAPATRCVAPFTVFFDDGYVFLHSANAKTAICDAIEGSMEMGEGIPDVLGVVEGHHTTWWGATVKPLIDAAKEQVKENLRTAKKKSR